MKNPGFFHFSLADFGRARSRTGVFRTVFFTVFFEGERHDLSKTGGFGRKMPPPPGKPVTFYECHPDDHAPAPSVRADFSVSDILNVAAEMIIFRRIGFPSESHWLNCHAPFLEGFSDYMSNREKTSWKTKVVGSGHDGHGMFKFLRKHSQTDRGPPHLLIPYFCRCHPVATWPWPPGASRVLLHFEALDRSPAVAKAAAQLAHQLGMEAGKRWRAL